MRGASARMARNPTTIANRIGGKSNAREANSPGAPACGIENQYATGKLTGTHHAHCRLKNPITAPTATHGKVKLKKNKIHRNSIGRLASTNPFAMMIAVTSPASRLNQGHSLALRSIVESDAKSAGSRDSAGRCFEAK